MFQERIIENQQKIQNIHLIPRNMHFDFDVLSLNKIISFIGPRRAGKTFFMYQLAQELLQRKTLEIQQIVFVDFSEYMNREFDFEQLLKDYYSLYPEKTPFFFFDEIQEVTNFRSGVLGLFNRGLKIVMSGSNSRMLSSELSTHFSGRNIEMLVYPLSFLEYLDFQGYEKKGNMTYKESGKLRNLFQNYLDYGAYPEIALAPNENLKLSILKNYFEILIYKDLKERYNISNEYVLRYLLKKAISSNTKDFNINKIFNELKSQNVEVSKNTLYNYVEYTKNIFFLDKLTNYHSPTGASKVFLIDWGFSHMYNEQDFGKKLENLIYIFLKARYHHIFFARGKQDIDFYIEKENLFIQAVFDLNIDNYQRELDSFIHISGKKMIIFSSNNLPETIQKNYSDIEFVDVLDYLMAF